MLLTIYNRTNQTVVVNEQIGIIAKGNSQRHYTLRVDQLEQARTALVRLEQKGVITWSIAEDPKEDDRAEGSVVALPFVTPIKTATIGNPVVPPYHVQVGTEFVRVDPTGAGPQSVVLPDPALFPAQTVLLKCVAGAPTQNILVSSNSGALVDGVVLLTIPPSPYLFLRFTSDGTAYWVT